MFGMNYIQFDSMTHVILYKNGKVSREGKGLSFFYFAPTSSIAAIPLGSNDLPFIFNESTNDYQTVSIQGQITYKISNPKALSELLDFTVDSSGTYKKNEIEKLNQRIINYAQTSTSSFIHGIGLKDSIRSAKTIETQILQGLQTSTTISTLGIEILNVNILAIRPNPEMERALETETRERLQQEADQAIYERRNFAVEQERKIKESELNTEIAVEEKKKFIETKVANQRKEAEAQGFVTETTLKPFRDIDWRTLVALNNNPDPKFNIALAFRQLAENAEKIGNLNISPELLEGLLQEKKDSKK
ncbi:SPFH domain-containing protein [Leptospira alstonii]|uniref:SPFH domain/Band 7 family protein n=3 Tax=Leptospira alstonii TaxID=28452 RepID=M6D0V9_9LEPT|nr:SPFH domain-containing protein [Leptospira alstonii]EMJ97584.1 SPFH domain/Band 7 family protein [Leptospira alstonii serovar Sichuan str. 79601]EQA79340.1 SPFH domain/Band 7 family protein [Leptospira alstonii serovar Pingchang str. 80-412]